MLGIGFGGLHPLTLQEQEAERAVMRRQQLVEDLKVDVDVQLLAYKLASAKHVHSISGIGRNEVKVLRQRALFA